MLRRPPRSTLFPYNDALPISTAGTTSGWRCRGACASSRGTSAATAGPVALVPRDDRSEEHTSELQSRENLVCRLLLEKKKKNKIKKYNTKDKKEISHNVCQST